jgi:hypothetical protein
MADRLPGATHVYHVALKPDYEIEQPSVTVSCDKMILKPVLSLGGPISGNCIQAQKGRQFTFTGCVEVLGPQSDVSLTLYSKEPLKVLRVSAISMKR